MGHGLRGGARSKAWVGEGTALLACQEVQGAGVRVCELRWTGKETMGKVALYGYERSVR